MPVDGSESSIRALQHGLTLGEMSQARVHILTAVDKGEASNLDRRIIERSLERDELRKIGKSRIRDALDATNGQDIKTEEIVVLERPQKAIIEYLSENPIDIVVMVRTGKSAIDRIVVGSVSDRVLKLADTPVLVVK